MNLDTMHLKCGMLILGGESHSFAEDSASFKCDCPVWDGRSDLLDYSLGGCGYVS